MTSYKQKYPIKGVYVRWHSSKIFPDYRDVSGPIVSQKRLNNAKNLVKKILDEEYSKIEKEYKKRFNGIITLNLEFAKYKVDNAKLSSTIKPEEEYYGWAMGDKIRISCTKMSDEAIIGTLLHEALHDIAKVNGKDVCENDEHIIIRNLGDVW